MRSHERGATLPQAVLIEAGGAGGWRPLTEEPGPGPQLLLWLVVSGQRDGMEVT